jgi:hypothetical protein
MRFPVNKKHVLLDMFLNLQEIRNAKERAGTSQFFQ